MRWLLAVLLWFSSSRALRLQGVGVRGHLLCGTKPLKFAQVKLFDVDTNPGDPDDLLDETQTNHEGFFEVDGTTRELTDIDPFLYIYHDCLDGIKPCQKKVTLKIPKAYIHSGVVKRWFDVGVLNMETGFPDQGRSCNHY